MTDSHTRGDSVRVDDHVRHETLNRVGEVFLSVGHSTSTFLTVTRGELITNLGHFDSSHLNLHKSFILIVCCQNDRVDVTFLRMFQGL